MKPPTLLAAIGMVGVSLLVGCAPSMAQTAPSVPSPSGAVWESISTDKNFSMRIVGCERDAQKQVICTIAFRNLTNGPLSFTQDPSGYRFVSPTGNSYEGYVVIDGAKLESGKLTYNIATGQTLNQRWVFPNVPQEVGFIPIMGFSGYEFRGIPIGALAQNRATHNQSTSAPANQTAANQAPANQTAANQAPANQTAANQAPANPFVAEYRGLVFTLNSCRHIERHILCEFTIQNTGTTNLDAYLLGLRAFGADGTVYNSSSSAVNGRHYFNLPGGLPAKGQIFFEATTAPASLAVMEFFAGTWGGGNTVLVQWRNVPVNK